jgi:hypothetical protein
MIEWEVHRRQEIQTNTHSLARRPGRRVISEFHGRSSIATARELLATKRQAGQILPAGTGKVDVKKKRIKKI